MKTNLLAVCLLVMGSDAAQACPLTQAKTSSNSHGFVASHDQNARASGDRDSRYPASWWQEVSREGAPAWEIMPQDAGPGEVILSKRTELGIFSNFTLAPFTLDGVSYQSVEGFWQMMKFPEGPSDARSSFAGLVWPFTRQQVSQMVAFEAKHAGDVGSKNMTTMGIGWVTYQGVQMPYKEATPGEHYRVIRRAMEAKLAQNPEVQRLLLATGDLILKPDHTQEATSPPEWRYCRRR